MLFFLWTLSVLAAIAVGAAAGWIAGFAHANGPRFKALDDTINESKARLDEAMRRSAAIDYRDPAYPPRSIREVN